MFVSTEMPSEQVMLRAVSKVSGVPISSIKMERGYEITPDQSRMVTDAIALLDKSKLLFFDQIRSIGQIEAEVMKQKHLGNPVRLLVVDYIQQLRADKSKSSRQEEISDISNRLMSLAIRERMTVIVCAQFNRTSDPYGKPELSQIKDCGSIEQDSSRVIALTKDRTDPKLTYFHILKNRGGEQGETKLTFYGSNMRFYPYRPGG
jgi:replicative DNA helicase